MLITFVFAIGLAVAPPLSSPPNTQEQGEIIVRGQRDVGKQIDDFVKRLTDVHWTEQVSRFDWSVCPGAVGLSQRQNLTAAKRMRAVAQAAGIEVGKPGCKTNVLLIVTNDKEQFISSLKRDHPRYFDGVPERVRRQLMRVDTPVAAWHVEGLLDADGGEVPRDRETGQYVVERTDTPSRISTQTRPHFIAAIVVVDAKALEGLTVVQLADYAAMRAFARTDPTRPVALTAPTILNVIEAPMNSAVPLTLTEWDLSYLKALYAAPENRLAGQQRRAMRRSMAQDLGKPPPPPK